MKIILKAKNDYALKDGEKIADKVDGVRVNPNLPSEYIVIEESLDDLNRLVEQLNEVFDL